MKKNVLSPVLILFTLFLILTGCSNPAGDGSTPGADLSGEETINYAPALPDTVYVIAGGKGNKDGSSWENAYADVQTAIDAAAGTATIVSPKYVMILGGHTYYPNSSPNIPSPASDREKHFSLKNNVTVIGGFKGDEPDRVPRGEATVLSGDIGVKDDKSDNGYHVFYHFFGETDLNSTAVLRNVTITGGNADGGGNHNSGGGVYNYSSSPVMENCTFSGNSATGGGGMYNHFLSSPAVKNCTFSNNSAIDGGGMSNSSSSPAVESCTFSGNNAAGIGGGMYNNSSNPGVEDCTFSGNSATNSGGGMYNLTSGPRVKNCTFSGNSASNDGGGMYNTGRSPTVGNCTFSGNSATNNGGGMYNFFTSSPTVYGSILVGNFITGGITVSEFSGNAFNGSSTANLIRGTTADQHNDYGTTFIGDISMVFTHIKDGKAELKNNGGPTETLMIKKEGPAYNKITTAPDWLPPKDQRGFSRPGNAADIGAVEWQDGDQE